ncbi:MAG TPA: alpha/beta hydrolase [Micromonosporaceae bacterium]
MRRISAGSGAPDTIVLIHGLWMTPRSWERWAERYQAAGFRVLTPAWPGFEGDIDQIRTDGSPIGRLTMRQVVDHYDRVIRELDKPPIIIGHSFGGSVVQVLLSRGLGAAGIAVDSGPVKGVRRLPGSTLRSAYPVLRSPANRHRPVSLSPEQFHYAFANTMSRRDSDAAYERYHVPAASHVLFEGAVASLNPRSAFRVDFGRIDRAPLLFIAGGADHISPPSVNKTNAGRYQRSPAVTGYREFPGRSHFIVGEDGWEEVADYALEWGLEAAAMRQPQPR